MVHGKKLPTWSQIISNEDGSGMANGRDTAANEYGEVHVGEL